jgi:hypothetical protein
VVEIFLIFAVIFVSPTLVAMPFYMVSLYKDKKEREAQLIIDTLRGPGPGRW